ncbi:DEAD/DEAH box helicase [Candidatus Micrarchaeota archaeon]|nr:DEAD/DEAH box helicase [Candidatus Micrarchaeota archaeon]
MEFKNMGLSPNTLHALGSLRYLEATEVQERVIPAILSGKNVMVRSQTGTGKTAAFGIAIVERLFGHKNRKALVLSPTRELAMQICKEIRLIASFYHMRILVVYGGHGLGEEISDLRRGVDILVATPGRLLDLSERRAVNLSEFDFVVLDEADRMLDMGFIPDIDRIMSQVSHERMTHLFSATLARQIYDIASKYIRDPEVIEVGELEKVAEIEEECIYLARSEKFGRLTGILLSRPTDKVIIFGATKRVVDYLWRRLNDQGIRAGAIHGDLSQSKRTKTMNDFKENRSRILVATDVAARGIHVENVALIINYDEAMDADTHLHRIGRTGRMGKSGKAITFVENKVVNRGSDQDYRDIFKTAPRRHTPRIPRPR